MSHRVPGVSHHLVGHVYCHVELFRKLDQFVQHLAEDLLTLREFPSARVVASEAGHDRIDYQQGCGAFDHEGCGDVEKLVDMLDRIPSSIFDVIQGRFRVEAETFSYLHDSLGSAE